MLNDYGTWTLEFLEVPPAVQDVYDKLVIIMRGSNSSGVLEQSLRYLRNFPKSFHKLLRMLLCRDKRQLQSLHIVPMRKTGLFISIMNKSLNPFIHSSIPAPCVYFFAPYIFIPTYSTYGLHSSFMCLNSIQTAWLDKISGNASSFRSQIKGE